MDIKEVHDIMENEFRCVERAAYCNRDCKNCDLVMDSNKIIEAYKFVINMLEKGTYEDIGQYISRDKAINCAKFIIEHERWAPLRYMKFFEMLHVLPSNRVVKVDDVMSIINCYSSEIRSEVLDDIKASIIKLEDKNNE